MTQRKIRLLDEELQLGAIVLAVALLCVTLLVQAAVTAVSLHSVARSAPTDGHELLAAIPKLLATGGLVTLVVLGPVVVALTLYRTHKIAGPIHGLTAQLQRYVAGGARCDLRVREGDNLREFAALIQRAVDTAEERGSTRASGQRDAGRDAPRRAA